jgi:hypothetical protein
MFVDRLLTSLDESGSMRGSYEETLSYTLLDGRPLVAIVACGKTVTDTRMGSEAPDPDGWAETTTTTKLSHEDSDRD